MAAVVPAAGEGGSPAPSGVTAGPARFAHDEWPGRHSPPAHTLGRQQGAPVGRVSRRAASRSATRLDAAQALTSAPSACLSSHASPCCPPCSSSPKPMPLRSAPRGNSLTGYVELAFRRSAAKTQFGVARSKRPASQATTICPPRAPQRALVDIPILSPNHDRMEPSASLSAELLGVLIGDLVRARRAATDRCRRPEII
jgi:hypothetical protein